MIPPYYLAYFPRVDDSITLPLGIWNEDLIYSFIDNAPPHGVIVMLVEE